MNAASTREDVPSRSRRAISTFAPSRRRNDEDVVVRLRGKSSEADLEQFRIGTLGNLPGTMDSGLVNTFQAMLEHRSVLFVEDVAPDLDNAVRTHADEVLVVRGVVELAQREPVRNRGLAAFAVGMMCAASRSSRYLKRQSAHWDSYARRTRSRNDCWCADLLFEVVTRRYLTVPVLITTNKPFSEWAEVFSSAACVVTLVDRLIHRSEIVHLDGESYRLREAKEQAAKRSKARSRRTAKSRSSPGPAP